MATALHSVNLRDLAGLAPAPVPRVLLVAEDPVFSRILRNHLEQLPAAVHEEQGMVSPEVLVLSLGPTVSPAVAAELVSRVRQQNPAAVVVTVSLPAHAPGSELLLSLGVSEHVDRSETHPRDVAAAVARAMRP